MIQAQHFLPSMHCTKSISRKDVKSLVIHTASTTHSQLTEAELLDQGIEPNTIPLSIGIEDADDLISGLDTAFKAVK